MLHELLGSNSFDAVALSFLSCAADVEYVRGLTAGTDRPIVLVAKVETVAGVNNIDEICRASDVVMAARGDLALAVDPPRLYAAVSEIASSAQKTGVPWMVATQILEGLDQLGFPTRAELTDIASWMDRGAAGAMLSRETVFGRRPIESIQYLRSLLHAAHVWRRD
jgi:pyruvate kinase